MALRSPTEFHNYWGNGFAAYAQLPNVAGSPTQNANLQTGDIAYVPGDGLYVNVLATLGAAIWTLSNVPIGTGIATISTARIDLYVSDINGNDANDGFTPLTALKTLTAAFAPGRNPDILAFDLVVHVGAHGGGGYTWATIDSYSLVDGASIYVYGDGAGQAGEDGFTVLVATVASAAGTTTSVVKSTAALGVDAYRGKTIEMVTGAAAGNRRTIRNNTATDIIPTVLFDAGIAPGDTYRIVEPAVDVAVVDFLTAPGTVLARGIGVQRKDFELLGDAAPSGLYIVNVSVPATAFTQAIVHAHNSTVLLFGVELLGTTYFQFSSCEVGYGETDTQLARAPALVASTTAWHGWGAYDSPGMVWQGGDTFYHGIVVAAALYAYHFVTGILRGGNLFGQNNLPSVLVDCAEVNGETTLILGPNSNTTKCLTLWITALGTGSCVKATGPQACIEFSFPRSPGGVKLTSAAALLEARDDAQIITRSGNSTGVAVSAGTFGCVANTGGKIGLVTDWITAFTTTPSPSGDCTIDSVVGRVASDLAAGCSYTSPDGSRIYRAA